MKINYSYLKRADCWALWVSVLLYFIIGGSCILIFNVYKLQRLVFDSRFNNSIVNHITPVCGIPYEELRCSVIQTDNDQILKYCLTDNSLMYIRILVPILMAMNLCIIQLFLMLCGKYSRSSLCVLWMSYTFAVVVIKDKIRYDSCFHNSALDALTLTSILLAGSMLFFLAEHRKSQSPLFINSKISGRKPIEIDDESTEEVDDEPTEEIDHEPTDEIDQKSMSWQNLL
ncbi:unnamed protein product [Adineta ricciae]|uniref:Uncharacterized protein n=1 Tax=Adineta ricciae TaxID=249248 RepID=A0A814ZE14_ADIRI|nr:unnamed protein product [Adineta ricciae]